MNEDLQKRIQAALANPQNIPAHQYYAHLGFKKIGEVPVQMGDWNFNDYLFSMSLTE